MKQLITAVVLAAAATTAQANDFKAKRDAEVKTCIQKGYAYFDSLGYGKGNYRLQNGRMRDDEVRIRCDRQPKTAFG